MSKTTNRFSPETHERARRMVLDHEGDHPSHWAAIVSISEKIGCVPQVLFECVKEAEVDSGKRARVPTEVVGRVKAREREFRDLRQANGMLRRRLDILRRRSSTARSGDDRVYRRSP